MAKKTKKKAKKWIQKVRYKMEREGTVGALRRTARQMGLLRGKEDTLTLSDLNRMEAHARKTGNTRLLRRVLFAKNVRKRKK